jgi:hypothetical protein
LGRTQQEKWKVFVLNLSEKLRQSADVIDASVASIPLSDRAQQDQGIDMISVQASEDARRGLDQRVRGS